jgi:hypothetical protein
VPQDPKSPPLTGLLVAISIVALWIGSAIYVCKLDVTKLLPLGILPAILGRTFIQNYLGIGSPQCANISGNRHQSIAADTWLILFNPSFSAPSPDPLKFAQ